MGFIENWNKEIDKEDLMKVAIKGAIAMVVTALVGALIDYVIFLINGNFTVGALIVSAFTALMMANSYKNGYHVKYSCLAILYVFIGLVLLNLLRFLFINQFRVGGLFSNPNTYLLIFLYPVYILISAIKFGGLANYFFAIIEISFYVSAFFLAYFLVRRNNNNPKQQ